MYARGPIEVCIAKYWRQQDRMQTAWNERKYFSKVISGVCRDPRSPLRSRVLTQQAIVFLFRHSPFLWQSPFLCKTCRGDIHTWTINYPDTIWKTSIWLELPIISSPLVPLYASHASDQWLTTYYLWMGASHDSAFLFLSCALMDRHFSVDLLEITIYHQTIVCFLLLTY